MTKIESVREMWNEYRRAVVPREAPPTQIIECRRAFYAGVWALFTRLNANADDGTEADALAQFALIDTECRAFKAAVGTPLEGRE